jgi:hypothetical protein
MKNDSSLRKEEKSSIFNNHIVTNFKIIGHDINKLNEGQEYIYTLKDKNVLEECEEDLEELENILLKKEEKKDFHEKDDLLFGKPKEILPQYTEFKQPEFIVNNFSNEIVTKESIIEDDHKSELAKIREKFKKMKNNSVSIF